MKRQKLVLMLFLAVMLVASTAESKEFGNARQTVVLECGVVPTESGPMSPPATPSPEVIAVSVTAGAPAITNGVECAIAIGELINNHFSLLSATPTSLLLPVEPGMPETNVSTVQYLFVSNPGHDHRGNDD